MIFQIGYSRYYYNDPQLEEIYKQYPETRKSFLTWHNKLGSVTQYVDIKTGKIYCAFPYPSSYFMEEKIAGVETLFKRIDVTKYNKDLIQLYRMLKIEKVNNLLKDFNIIICAIFTGSLMLPILIKDNMQYDLLTSILNIMIYLFSATVIGCLVDLVTTWIPEVINDK